MQRAAKLALAAFKRGTPLRSIQARRLRLRAQRVNTAPVINYPGSEFADIDHRQRFLMIDLRRTLIGALTPSKSL